MKKCLKCGEKRKKILIHNTNGFFCTSDCRRIYYSKLKNKIAKLKIELKKLIKHKKEIYGK